MKLWPNRFFSLHAARIICSLSLGSLLPAAQAQSPDRPSLTALLPPNVQTMIYVRDVKGTAERIGQSPFSRFYDDPRSAPFLAPLRDMLETDSRELAGIFASGGSGASEALTGSLLVARVRRRGAGNSARGSGSKSRHLILFHHGGDSARLASLIEPVRRRGDRIQRIEAEAAGLAYTRVQRIRQVYEEIAVRGGSQRPAPASVLRSRERRGSSALGKQSLARRQVVTEEQLYLGPALVVRSDDDGLMRETLQRMSAPGGGSSTPESSRRDGVVRLFETAPDLEIYLDLEGLTGRGASVIEEGLLGADVNLKRLGLDEIKSLAVGLSFLPDRLQIEVILHVPRPRWGLGKLLFMNEPLDGPGSRLLDPAAESIPRLLPADAAGAFQFSADLPGLWSELRAILAEGAPDLSALLDVVLHPPSGRAVPDFDADIMAHLGRRLVSFSRVARGPGASPGAFRGGSRLPRIPGPPARRESTLMIEVRNPTLLRPALRRWLGSLAMMLNFPLEETSIGSATLFRIAGAENTTGLLVPLGPLVNVCLTDQWLYLSPRREHIEAALVQRELAATATGPTGLASRKDFVRVRSELAPGRFFEAYLSAGGLGDALQSPVMQIIGDLAGGLGDSLLRLDQSPGDNVWSEHFGSAGTSIRSGEDNLIARLFLLYPESGPESGPKSGGE